ncbi:hypothetical protein Q5741_15840 [Paenibacillus sp. JX-17]|uniref:Uncharacterized protein n=1 Tax=Paenibacillus lacisoli TaxID=3064525 RepID=A0ABT9CGW0_9BACL|nr:hypothetical protein [Paenibacillus sp. JX-17]MDO7907884.1 hypothetical protein [Paenibacillus sp. JX-17]
MATNSTAPSRNDNRKDKNMRGMVSVFTIISVIAAVVGIIMVLVNLNHFSDRNLGLMLGIGFIVGSIFVYSIGKWAGSIQSRREEDDGGGGF